MNYQTGDAWFSLKMAPKSLSKHMLNVSSPQIQWYEGFTILCFIRLCHLKIVLFFRYSWRGFWFCKVQDIHMNNCFESTTMRLKLSCAPTSHNTRNSMSPKVLLTIETLWWALEIVTHCLARSFRIPHVIFNVRLLIGVVYLLTSTDSSLKVLLGHCVLQGGWHNLIMESHSNCSMQWVMHS